MQYHFENPHKDKIIKLHNTTNLSYTEIAEKLDMTRNAVAGIVWRSKNPGQKIKGMTRKEYHKKFGTW